MLLSPPVTFTTRLGEAFSPGGLISAKQLPSTTEEESNWIWRQTVHWVMVSRSIPAEAKTDKTMVRLEPESQHGSFERR